MTFDNPIVNQCLVESAVVLLLCGITVVLCLIMTSAGRSLLQLLIDFFRGHRARSVFLIGSAWLLTAYAGTKPPPVILEEGIELTKCIQYSDRVFFAWEVKNGTVQPGAEFEVQEFTGDRWYTIGRTKEMSYTHFQFTVEKNRYFRISTTGGRWEKVVK